MAAFLVVFFAAFFAAVSRTRVLCPTKVMIVSNLAVENRFANGTQGRLMSWYPAKIASNKAVLASHPELVARFVKETALTKSELFPDLVPYI